MRNGVLGRFRVSVNRLVGAWVWLLLVGFALVMALPAGAFAESHKGDFYKEFMLIGGYSDVEQWIGGDMMMQKNSVGFEYYRKFSDEYGDYMTLDLQMRFGYDTRFSSNDAFGFEIHNAWLDFNTGIGSAFRVGHFQPVFGLETEVDTHATLLQTLAMQNIGFKHDWGIGYRGLLGEYDYQVGAQVGSGMSILAEDDNYLLTGRISASPERDEEIGLSVLYGQTLQPMQNWSIPKPMLKSNESILKKRVGLDYQCPLWLFDFKTEGAIGQNDGETVGGALAQIEYTLPEDQDTKLKLQLKYWSNDLDKKNAADITLQPVFERKFSEALTFRASYYHDLYSPGQEDRAVVLQLYYFGK